MARENRIDWDLLKKLNRRGKLTPVIGDRVGHHGFLTSDALVQEWAAKIGYPMTSTRNITRVAQYRSDTTDPFTAKEDFLDFLKQYLLNQVKAQYPEDFLDMLEEESDELDFSMVADRLTYPNFAEEEMNPLSILAQFKIPIYITTSFHPFMERALKKTTSKTPRIEICPWYEKTITKLSLLDADDYEDDSQKPIVYHLHGINTKPESLVFTEDDYLDFLVKTTVDPHVVPARIVAALASSSLLLIGYELQDWDFRVLFRGLIRSWHKANRPRSICLQLEPKESNGENSLKIEKYLQTYFSEYKFDIYWGESDTFAQELWAQLGES